MLKHRIITAAILIPIVVWGIFKLDTFPYFAMLLGIVSVLGILEWSRLIELNVNNARLSYVVVFVALLFSSLALMESTFLFSLLLLVSVGWWGFQLLGLQEYDGNQSIGELLNFRNLWAGYALLIPTWASLVFIHQHSEHGAGLVLFLMILIWTADSGAYFAGRKYGKTKLAPLISPGKTKEGMYGGMVASAIVAVFGGAWLQLGFFEFIFFVALSMLVVVFSVGGDLYESVAKRRAGVKDSGHLLPGHGGVLDRIDSLMAASPVFTLGIWLLGIIG